MPRKPTGRPVGRPAGMPVFARVSRAREALQKEAEAYVKLHKTAAQVAAKRGNSQPAQWALEHITAIDAGGKEIRPIGAGIDRQQTETGQKGPIINVGWIASPSAPAALPGPPQLAIAVSAERVDAADD